jgi:hypothetical protein
MPGAMMAVVVKQDSRHRSVAIPLFSLRPAVVRTEHCAHKFAPLMNFASNFIPVTNPR